MNNSSTTWALLIIAGTFIMLMGFFLYSSNQSYNEKISFCVSNGFETYQNEKCIKITEDNKINSRNVICIEYASIKLLSTKCGWEE